MGDFMLSITVPVDLINMVTKKFVRLIYQMVTQLIINISEKSPFLISIFFNSKNNFLK